MEKGKRKLKAWVKTQETDSKNQQSDLMKSSKRKATAKDKERLKETNGWGRSNDKDSKIV